jgi:hypothetical protein
MSLFIQPAKKLKPNSFRGCARSSTSCTGGNTVKNAYYGPLRLQLPIDGSFTNAVRHPDITLTWLNSMIS